MVPGAFAPTQRNTSYPEHEEDHSQYPEEMYRDPDASEYEDQ